MFFGTVLEKSWIGSGNAGRNTTIIRSNYLLPGNIPFYERSMKLWEGLEQGWRPTRAEPPM
jgi:sarcosine oxidase subunit beta